MNTSQRVALFGAALTAAATIVAAFIVLEKKEDFWTDMQANAADCHALCNSKGAVCIGAQRIHDEPIGCEFKGVKSGEQFVNRAKSCLCRKL